MKFQDRPTNRSIERVCDNCKEYKSNFYLTEEEIMKNINIFQWCPICKKTVKFVGSKLR